MTDRHPEHKTLERYLEGVLPEAESRTLQRHLLVCLSCEERLIALLPGSTRLRPLPPVGEGHRQTLLRSLRRGFPEVSARHRNLSEERLAAPGLWRELERHPQERRRSMIWEDARFQSWGFFELLLERARQATSEDACRAEDILRLALDVTEQLGPERHGPGARETAKVRVWAWLGNASRVLGDFRRAEAAFQTAELYLSRSWLDPLDEALLLELKAPLRRAQRRFEEAVELIEDAIAIYREINEPHLHGRALLVKGLALQYKGDLKAAADCFRTSLFLLDGIREPRLIVHGQHNLIGCLHESGRNAEAAALIPDARKIYEQLGARSYLLRLLWIEGKVLASQGLLSEAAEALVEVRETFLEDGIAFDAALVSLDLATLYLRQDRPAETRLLAAEILPVFQSREIYQEAVASLIVFQKAAEMEQLTLGLIEEIASYLAEARNNPHLRFRGEDGTGA
jgi:tetratricopeptide (TPR) repeat protein